MNLFKKYNVTSFFGLYLVFVISITLSIVYTQQTHFNKLIFNTYVINKILIESLKYALILFITNAAFNNLLFLLSKYKTSNSVNTEGKILNLKNNYFLDSLIFVLAATIALPIKTVVTAFYSDAGSTFFRLNFVHFHTNIKIVVAIIILLTIFIYIVKKYTLSALSLAAVSIILILPTAYFISSTRTNNFDTLQAKLQAVSGVKLFNNSYLSDKETGELMKPKAEKLLSMASTDTQNADAYYWMAIVELNLDNNTAALSYIDQSLSIEEKSASYMLKAQIYRNLKNFDEAITFAEKCLEIASNNKNSVQMAACESEIGLGHLYKGQYDYGYLNKDYFVIAQSHIEKASLLDPEQSFYKIGLNEVLLQDAVSDYNLKNYESAIQKFSYILVETDSFKPVSIVYRAHAFRGNAKAATGDYRSALTDFLKASTLSNENAKSMSLDIGLTYEHLGENDLALKYYRKAISVDQNDTQMPKNSYILDQISRVSTKL